MNDAVRSRRFLACAFVVAVATGASGGCSPTAAGEPGGSHTTAPATFGDSTGPIGRGAVFYLDQVGTTHNSNGENLVDALYKATVASCKGAPTKALSPAEEQKLGTVRVQIWEDDSQGRTAIRTDEFSMNSSMTSPPLSCSFTLRDDAHLHLWLGNRAYDIDLGKRTGTVQTVSVTKVPAHAAKAPDYARLAAEGLHKIGPSSMAGQPCVVWRDDQSKASWCTWSGGTKWGYPVDGTQGFPHFESTPTLWEKDASGGNSHTTTRFVVGSLPDAGIFNLPADVKIRDTDPL